MEAEVEAASARPPRAGRSHAVVLRTALGLAAGAMLMYTFVRLVDFSAVSERVQHLRVGLALLCGAAFLGAYVVRAMRWRVLLRPSRVSVGRAAAIYQVAIFVNWLLPIRAGELVKSLLLRRSDGIPVSQSLATVGMDKAMDLLPAVALLAVLPFVHVHLGRPMSLLLVWALAVVVCGILILGLAAHRRDRTLAVINRVLGAVLPQRARRRIAPFVVRFIDTLLQLVRQPRLMLLAAAYTAVAVGLDALFCLLAFRAVGTHISVPVVLYGYTLYNLAYILPTPPGQIGSNEVIGLLIFSGMFGVDREGVGAMFLFSHPWTAALMACSGLLCLSAMGLSLRSTLQLAREPAAEVESA
jgi:uncharacterized protein (TIRG00374 family)